MNHLGYLSLVGPAPATTAVFSGSSLTATETAALGRNRDGIGVKVVSEVAAGKTLFFAPEPITHAIHPTAYTACRSDGYTRTRRR